MSNVDENSHNEIGANSWLVEEMYEQWKANPDAVDKEWWPILERYRGGQTENATPTLTNAPAATPVAPPAPSAPAQTTEATIVNEQLQPAATEAPEPSQLVAKTTRVEARPQPIPAQAPVTGLIDVIEDGEDQVNVLKGMSKALADRSNRNIGSHHPR